MSSFRTEISLTKSNFNISHNHNIMAIGSCFTENIGLKLEKYKFNTLINPFGIVYNPISIKNNINLLLNPKTFKKEDLIYHNGLWNSFYHHSKFSFVDLNITLENINNKLIESSDFFRRLDYLLITFGSSYVYEYNCFIVSNCHKIPEKNFKQYLLNLNTIINTYNELLEKIKAINKEIKVIFTVSPVRYLKYGSELNQVSKSLLILSIYELKKKFDFVDYFPSYELIMDDLRDYRFYNDDMIHPSDLAINYIWEKFSEKYFDNKTANILKQLTKVINSINHKPFKPNSPEYKIFLEKLLVKIEDINNKNPEINFQDYINLINLKLTGLEI